MTSSVPFKYSEVPLENRALGLFPRLREQTCVSLAAWKGVTAGLLVGRLRSYSVYLKVNPDSGRLAAKGSSVWCTQLGRRAKPGKLGPWQTSDEARFKGSEANNAWDVGSNPLLTLFPTSQVRLAGPKCIDMYGRRLICQTPTQSGEGSEPLWIDVEWCSFVSGWLIIPAIRPESVRIQRRGTSFTGLLETEGGKGGPRGQGRYPNNPGGKETCDASN